MKTLQFILILLSISAYSQPPKNYNDYNSQYSQDRREGQKNYEKQADLNRQPNSPTTRRSSNTPFVWQGEVPYLLKTKEEKAAYDAAAKQRQQVAEDKKNEERESEKKRETQKSDAEFQKYSNWYDKNSSGKKEYMRQILDQFKSQNLFTELESKISAEELFYYANINDNTNQNYQNSLEFVSKLKVATMKEPLDSLVNYIWGAQLFPDFSINYLKKLQAAYPAKKEYLEKNELMILGNYFGANITDQFDTNQYYYPKSGFEMMDDKQKTEVLNRFEELESLYPEAAKQAAGRCRIGFNMFQIYAEYNSLPLKNKSSAKRTEYYIKTLETMQPKGWLPSSVWKEDTWKKVADLYLKNAAFYLQWNNPDYVKNLSTEKWLEIGNAYQIKMEYVAWAFRNILSPDKFINAYPNLTYARIYDLKKREDGDGVINKDMYLSEIKNAKPNGTGINNLVTGDFYEGSLKEGKPHGKGKAYYLYNTNRAHAGDLYVGEFKNGDWNGMGKLIIINGSYKEGQFKKNEDYKMKYYNNLKTEISKEKFENSK